MVHFHSLADFGILIPYFSDSYTHFLLQLMRTLNWKAKTRELTTLNFQRGEVASSKRDLTRSTLKNMVPKHLKYVNVSSISSESLTWYYTGISQLNTCHSDHEAITRANLSIPGYKVNGTGLALCSRHAMVRSNGVGDLVKGEKLISFSFLSILLLTYINH